MVKRINRKLLDELKGGPPKRLLVVWDNHDGTVDAEVERLEELHEGEDVEIVIVGWIPPGEPEAPI